MADNNLLFQIPQQASPNLVFGEDYTPVPATAVLDAALPAFGVRMLSAPTVFAEISASFPAFSVDVEARYASYAQRPTVGATASDWQATDKYQLGIEDRSEDSLASPAGSETKWSLGVAAAATVKSEQKNLLEHTRIAAASRFSNAERAAVTPRVVRHQDSSRASRLSRAAHHQNAIGAHASGSVVHQDALRDRRGWRTAAHSAADHRTRQFSRGVRWADPLGKPWIEGHQDAQRPPAGTSKRENPPVTPPITPGCYAPSADIVFRWPNEQGRELVFICDNWTPPPVPAGPVVIPVLRTYIVVNEIKLTRVSNSTPIKASTLSVGFDCDSWLPTFSATIPEAARDAVMPDPSPVEVEVSINGTQFRFFVEKISRSRQFGQSTVAISGRGIACELDAPYAVASQHTNATQMTAQQLIDSALEFTGYTQTWNITDWLVPANTFSLYGAPASVAASVAEASGSVLAADRKLRNLKMQPRYPVKPWEWATATPDYVIPSAVTQTESLEWIEKPSYNVVYVSGEQDGVLGQVKITGTAGDLAAPMVTHPLITHADAARQRGISILGDTGRKAMMQISLPVLESTGVIDICKLIEFSDGANTRRGIVRANNISVNWPTVRQTLTVEAAA